MLLFLPFLLTGLIIYIGIYYITPKLTDKGYPLLIVFWASLWLPVLFLLPITLLLYRYHENGLFTWSNIIDRFRLHQITGWEWALVFGAIVMTLVIEEVLQPISKKLAKHKLLAPPNYLPAPFNPLKKFEVPPKTFFNTPLQGNYKLILIFIPIHILAMISEEIMWRGYILPLQIEVFGNFAWLINGLMWAWLVHLCLKWHFIAMLPSMLIVPYIAQYTNSTLAGFYVHAVPNTLIWIILLTGILKKHPEVSSPSTNE